MAKPPTNIAASVRARLLNLARQANQPFDVLLTRFVHERLLYRLSLSPHADRFVLKGAMLLATWLPETARGTRDLDLLGFGDASEQRILGIFREVLAIAADDGVAFDLDALQVGLIREELEALAVSLDLYDDIIFYGYMLHPEEFMPFFDVFVLPSRAEAFGSVFAEAALCWLALVGTNVGGIAEQIDDGVNGLLVPPEDPAALAAALEKLVTDPTYRYNLARSGWDKAKKVYSLTRVISQLKKVYIQMKPEE